MPFLVQRVTLLTSLPKLSFPYFLYGRARQATGNIILHTVLILQGQLALDESYPTTVVTLRMLQRGLPVYLNHYNLGCLEGLDRQFYSQPLGL